jgi:colicin import membrane protein
MSDRAVMERQADIRLNSMILISLLLHLLLLSLLFFTPSFPSPKRTFGPVYNVALVSFSGTIPKKKGETAAAKELLKVNRSETVLKKSIEPAPAVPIRSIETRKKQEQEPKQDRELEKAMERIRKKAAATGPVAQPPTQAKAVPEQTAVPASQPGDVDISNKMQAYYAAIWFRIKGKWALPQGMLPDDGLEAVIDVTILRSGGVTKITFEKRSGNRYFDESALKAIQKALPFPPFPPAIGGGSLEVGIRFHSTDLRS